ncbi:MAG: YdcF family protein, partial [Acidimicrobiia bacterium]
GKQAGDRVTQGFAGYRYLRAKGVPEEAIRVEVDGTDSYSELSAAAAILRRDRSDDVLIVTDPYHALRVEAIADEVGLRAHVSPTSTAGSPGQYLRETVAVALGRLVSFRRLAAWR